MIEAMAQWTEQLCNCDDFSSASTTHMEKEKARDDHQSNATLDWIGSQGASWRIEEPNLGFWASS